MASLCNLALSNVVCDTRLLLVCTFRNLERNLRWGGRVAHSGISTSAVLKTERSTCDGACVLLNQVSQHHLLLLTLLYSCQRNNDTLAFLSRLLIKNVGCVFAVQNRVQNHHAKSLLILRYSKRAALQNQISLSVARAHREGQRATETETVGLRPHSSGPPHCASRTRLESDVAESGGGSRHSD